MKITVIGSVATIKSNIKLADIQGDVTLRDEKNEPIYTVRRGQVWNLNTASFNNADAEGNAIFQINMEGKTAEEVKASLTADSDVYSAFAAVEDLVAAKIEADKEAKNAFASAIVMA